MAELQVGAHTVDVKNLDKVLFPDTGFTKGDLIEYYRGISDLLIPHLEGRPLSMRRFPDGVESGGFWEKRCPSHRPEWVHTAVLWSDSNKEEIEFCTADDPETLVWAANLADIELHVTLARAEAIERPTSMAFDLDPGSPAGILECGAVALELRSLFEQLGLDCHVKTSGSKGLQVYVPLNSDITYKSTKSFAKAVAETFAHRDPDRIVANMRKDLRKGKVLIDWSQNDQHKTTVCVYSVRAKEAPGVSTPVTWDELSQAVDRQDASLLSFSPENVLARVAEHGDLFRPVLEVEQALPSAADLD